MTALPHAAQKRDPGGFCAPHAGQRSAPEGNRLAAAPFGEDSAGKLLLIDALSLRFRTLRLPKDPGCPACGHA